MNAFIDVWVSPAGSYNLLQTTPFTPSQQGALARLPGVRVVRLYRGGLLGVGELRRAFGRQTGLAVQSAEQHANR